MNNLDKIFKTKKIAYLTHQAFMAHIVWYSENTERKNSSVYSETQTEQKYAFGADADADIYIMKFWCL